ncbi:MAG TPA: hypothetical protein VHU77_11380 [Candidatus Limnocylindria bacterium]|jgi:hypothetical protein|nr:hypothetical protein [Candidatus Limnocylindria bacterium]
MIVSDMRRLRAIVNATERTMTWEEGSLVANYARTLAVLARARKRPGGLGDKTEAELLEMAMGIPELRAALAGGS